MDDVWAWTQYPRYHNYANKLWFNEKVGNVCGPAGVAVPGSHYYAVRPTYNLSGMGSGARKVFIEAGRSDPDDGQILPGEFWTEWFEGDHLTVDYSWDFRKNRWEQLHVFKASRRDNDPLYKFSKWTKIDTFVSPPVFLRSLNEVPIINVEYIGGHPIEVHLRENPDPVEYNEIVPDWKDTPNDPVKMKDNGYIWLDSPDDANRTLPDVRQGFWVK